MRKKPVIIEPFRIVRARRIRAARIRHFILGIALIALIISIGGRIGL
jgi:hypothetical protein